MQEELPTSVRGKSPLGGKKKREGASFKQRPFKIFWGGGKRGSPVRSNRELSRASREKKKISQEKMERTLAMGSNRKRGKEGESSKGGGGVGRIVWGWCMVSVRPTNEAKGRTERRKKASCGKGEGLLIEEEDD